MSEQVRYVIDEHGEPVGVLLDLEVYHRLTNPTSLDPEYLIGLGQDELKALAESLLAPSAQTRLDKLLVRNCENQLCADEIAELERLLAQIDQLTIIKTRARYTLNFLKTSAKVL